MKFFKKNGHTYELSFNSEVKDSSTGQVVLTVDDVREIELKDMSEPFTSEGDTQALSDVLDFWARKLATIIVRKMI